MENNKYWKSSKKHFQEGCIYDSVHNIIIAIVSWIMSVVIRVAKHPSLCGMSQFVLSQCPNILINVVKVTFNKKIFLFIFLDL